MASRKTAKKSAKKKAAKRAPAGNSSGKQSELAQREEELKAKEQALNARQAALDAQETAILNRGGEDDGPVVPSRFSLDRDQRDAQVAGIDTEAGPDREVESVHEDDEIDFSAPQFLLNNDLLREPRPGYAQRWVRTTFATGDPDHANMMRKYNQGWRPRRADTVPNGHAVPTITEERYGGEVIGIQGCILMERPLKLHQAHARANRDAARDLDEAVKHDLFKVHEPGQTGFGAPQRSGKTTVTRGRPAEIADD